MPVVKTTDGKMLSALKKFRGKKRRHLLIATMLGVGESTVFKKIREWKSSRDLEPVWDGEKYVLKSTQEN